MGDMQTLLQSERRSKEPHRLRDIVFNDPDARQPITSTSATIELSSFAYLIEAIGSDRFFETLRHFICNEVHIDNCVALVFSENVPPLKLHHWSPQQPNYFEMLYCQGAYILDPFYRFGLEDRSASVHLLRDVAPDDFHESEFYETYYRKVEMIDELGLLSPIDADRTIHLSLGRRSCSDPFSPADVARICHLEPILISLLKRHAHETIECWKAATIVSEPCGRRSGLLITNRWLRPFGATGREGEIAGMVLRGHSNTSIGLTLGISAETVKVHRRNLYAKLRISSQAELFMLFINHILEAGELGAR